MKIRAQVRRGTAVIEEVIVDAPQEGEVTDAIREVIEQFRKNHPGESLFDDGRHIFANRD